MASAAATATVNTSPLIREEVILPRTPFDFAAWLIDLDGTLYSQPPVRCVMAVQVALFGRLAIPIIRQFRREHERMHEEAVPANSDPFEIQIKRTAERLGVESERVRVCVDEWMFVRPAPWLRLFRRRSLLRKIDEFRARGGKTAIVSDYPASRKLTAMGIVDRFDVVVASGEPGGPGQLKPHPAGYESAAAALGLNPVQCLVIGDRSDADGEAARRAKMQFWHVASRWTA